MISKRLEQVGAHFVGKAKSDETAKAIKQAVTAEMYAIEVQIGHPPPWPNVPRIRAVIQRRIDGHNN